MESITVIIYETKTKKRPFIAWLEGLDVPLQTIVATRIGRVRMGNFGDCDPLREGLWELKIHTGAGYRVYFGKKGNTVVIILTGGSKKSQAKDIEKAAEYWKLYKEENG